MDKGVYSRKCKVAILCCSVISCLLVALLITLGVLASTMRVPQAEVTNVTITSLAVTRMPQQPGTLTFSIDIGVLLDNQNVQPLSATVESLGLEVLSLDKLAADQVGAVHVLGTALLRQKVKVSPKSATAFTVTVHSEKPLTSALDAVAERFRRDCGAVSGLASPKGTTRIRLRSANFLVTVWRLDAKLQISLDRDVECEPP